VRLRTKHPPEKFLGGSIIFTGFFVAPRGLFTAAAVEIVGNGRRGREVGNDGFRMGRERADGRVGEVGEASGDETRGRLVLSASDMVGCDSALFRNEGTDGERQVRRVRGYLNGGVRVESTKAKEKREICGASERVSLKRVCMWVESVARL
jgi:hypothetical protein